MFVSPLSSTDYFEKRTVAAFYKHPSFLLETNFGGAIVNIANDIGLVQLVESSSAGAATWTADRVRPNAGETVRAVGFGLTSSDGFASRVLMEATMTIDYLDVCQDSPYFKSDQMACTTDVNKVICAGDSL